MTIFNEVINAVKEQKIATGEWKKKNQMKFGCFRPVSLKYLAKSGKNLYNVLRETFSRQKHSKRDDFYEERDI